MNIGASDEHFKYILKKEYLANDEVVVDDLFILSLPNCRSSQLNFCLYCTELIVSAEAKECLVFYQNHCHCFEISKKLYSRITSKENSVGILVCTKIISKRTLPENPFILVCDGLEISGNIGTIFRTAEAIHVDQIVFTNIKAKIKDDKVIRASRGMIFNVPFIEIPEVSAANQYLDQLQCQKIICEPEQGKDFKTLSYQGAIACIVGSERFGVDPFWFSQADDYLKIPMFGEMDSLNVAVATSLILYEAKYKRTI